MRLVLSRFHLFCSAQSKRMGGVNPNEVLRSGGKSSYIGFGRFDGLGSEKGDMTKSVEYLQDALKAHTSVEMNPDQARESARYHHEIAMCRHRGGDIQAALSEYNRSIRVLEDLLLRLPSDDPQTANLIKRCKFDLSSALSGLAVALADIGGKDAESLDHSLKALEIRKALMGPNHPSVAECLNNLGSLYFRQENFNKAADMYQESLRILLTKTQGKEDNKYVALAYYNIGLTYNKLGIKKGIDAIHKALVIANHIWGPNHDQTIQIRSTLEELQV
jgi:tetratricopeptide (TPR) repeat protein